MSDDSEWVLGDNWPAQARDFGDEVAMSDHKISFAVEHCKGKEVLDLGCVHHNPENYKSRFWLHKALKLMTAHLDGLDIYEDGARYLCDLGFNVAVGDAQNFEMGRKYDVIVAGDLVEHLENLSGFFESCRRHLKSGGKILVSTPNPWYWRHFVKAALFSRVENNPEHTLWLCPVTLAQVAARHHFRVESISFGSRYRRDRVMPLPKGIKHTSFHAVLAEAMD